ncbi:C13 family peptidase [Caulobacter sp. 73W]|uniref:C13 family peptidase n=1 Tax=Caulobacter sp. 73W TaxID=3161137 RepID=A0AB39KQW2_9CAUL
MRGLAGVVLAFALALPSLVLAASPFADWAVVVVAADNQAHGGGVTEAFDNARRDVSTQLATMGFSPSNISQFSVQPEKYASRPKKTDLRGVYEQLKATSGTAKAGCLLYFTSHGEPRGITFGEGRLSPALLAAMIEGACPGRPVIAVISACFSGVFVDPLAGPQRMVMTAARPDRSSFGCGESDRYPYFDECFLRTTATARDFMALASGTKACVSAKEIETKAEPPSEPQVWIGGGLRPILPLYAFARPPTP